LLHVVYRWMHLSFLNYSAASVVAVTYRAGNQPQQYSPSGGGRFAGARLSNGSEKAADGLDSLIRKHRAHSLDASGSFDLCWDHKNRTSLSSFSFQGMTCSVHCSAAQMTVCMVLGSEIIPDCFVIRQGAYNSGKHGNLREFVNSGKLREFKIYSGNLYDTISWASSCVHNCQ